MKDCVFCKIAKGEISTEDFIYENDNFFSVLDVNLEVEGHSLVISKKHFENVLELPILLGPDLLDCIKETAIILMKKYNAEGFNVVSNNFEVAQQVVQHTHFHIFPRKKGDGEIKFVK